MASSTDELLDAQKESESTVAVVSANVPAPILPLVAPQKFKFKYKEAAPAPPGATPEEWNRTFSAADSRIYNRNGKSSAKSQSARASGETRVLALQMLAKKRANAASQPSPTTNPTADLSSTAVAADPTTTMESTQDKIPTSKVPTAGGNKAIKLESPSRDATPNGFTEPPTTIADKVKGKSRAANKKSATPRTTNKKSSSESSQLGSPAPASAPSQAPAEFFGRQQDVSQVQPFNFGPSSMPDNVGGAKERFEALGNTFESMNLKWEEDHPMAEVNARDPSDFVPEEKPVSGLGKRYAGFEPFARSPSNTPAPVKAAKKKTNRGKKRAAAAKKKKIATIEDKDKAKSPEPEQDDDASEGASSNDGGEYCICRGPDDHRKMIACDLCDEWYHCSCVGVKEDDIALIDKYICQKCEVPEAHYTTWKPMCRLAGCRKPCDLTINPPSKYCSPDHKAKFWEDTVARAPDGPEPSRGGALTKAELKALLESKRGDVKAFHALGKKPTLPTPEEDIDWNKFLTNEETGRLCDITTEKLKLKERSQGFKDREKVVRMAMERLKKVTESKKELNGICGWDERLAMNEEEFDVWRKSPAGIEAFKTGTLDGTYCDKKRCTRHALWVKLSIQDARYEDVQVAKALNKLRAEEHSIKDRANTRAASQL